MRKEQHPRGVTSAREDLSFSSLLLARSRRAHRWLGKIPMTLRQRRPKSRRGRGLALCARCHSGTPSGENGNGGALELSSVRQILHKDTSTIDLLMDKSVNRSIAVPESNDDDTVKGSPISCLKPAQDMR
jgi:hypothetical protein